MFFKTTFAAAALSLAAYLPAAAATLVVDPTGKLTGATGVNVDGALYDVMFTDGTCSQIYDGCDSSEDFIFNEQEALAASGALLGLFNTAPVTSFTDDPSLTAGCEATTGECLVNTPYSALGASYGIASFWNLPSNGGADYTFAQTSFLFGPNSGTSSVSTWAVWTTVAPIPLPATLPFLLTGLAGFAALSFRKGRAAQI